MTDDGPVARPTLDQELYVYADEDLSQICTELYLQFEAAGFSTTEAALLADYAYSLLTGGWLDTDE